VARIQLLLTVQPGSAEVIVNLRESDLDNHVRIFAYVDTGAEISLLPLQLLERLDYRPIGHGRVVIEQAGIARQSFEAVEALVWVFLEDTIGTRTSEMEVRCWFANTEKNVIGFDGLLDRATLFVDMRQTRTGWSEFGD
jgi:hypothetical protein